MSPTRSRSLAPLLVASLLLGSGLLAGCGVSSDDDEPSSSVTASVTPEPSPSDLPTPTVTVTASPSASPTPTAAASPSLTPDAALLTANEMPALNDTVRWKQGATGPVSSQAFGLCAKFDVLSIGAEQAVERRFTAGSKGTASTDTAAQQIATFPDATTTARATKVLQAWHKTCAARVKGTAVRVGPISSVPVAKGTGWWYLVSYVRGGEGHFHGFGVDVVGNRVSLVAMDVTGADHDYPSGQDPVQLAVKAAAGKLG
jgi:hypothetical protein